ncbi:MAG: DUF2147 domain-containing protein [Salinisphaera sp.]|jgi:uncharacterized protein (DUF2147 family)|nr:DUF2147 domain-containing protein [Salinisphaera sp.]
MRIPGLLFLLAFIPGLAVAALPPSAIAGFWKTAGGEAIIKIQAQDGRFPGRIVWLRDARYPPDDPQGRGGQAVTDQQNPDVAKRARLLIGMKTLKNLNYRVSDDDQAEWVDGRVYDPERGRWFHCRVRLADPDHLKLHGYIGIPLIGRTTTWTRVDDPRSP